MSNSRSPSPDFASLSIAEDLVPIRPAKPAGQTSISFSSLLDPPLLLHEDLKEGCGGQLWPAGMVLAEHLLRNVEELRGKVVLELGAGGGLVGLALALALSRSPKAISANTEHPILTTDLPQLLPLQKQNIELNNLSSSIISASLPWGSPLPDTIPEKYKRPDVIIAADCVYFEPAFPLLLETLAELLQRPDKNDDKGYDPVCWFCMKKRRTADMRFVAALKKKFRVERIEMPSMQNKEYGNVFSYKITTKRQALHKSGDIAS